MIILSAVWEWLGKHISVEMDTDATVEELLGVVFPVWSVPRLYSEHERD